MKTEWVKLPGGGSDPVAGKVEVLFEAGPTEEDIDYRRALEEAVRWTSEGMVAEGLYTLDITPQIEHAEQDKVGCGVPLRLWETRRGDETHEAWMACLLYVIPSRPFEKNDKLYAVYHVYGDGEMGEVNPDD